VLFRSQPRQTLIRPAARLRLGAGRPGHASPADVPVRAVIRTQNSCAAERVTVRVYHPRRRAARGRLKGLLFDCKMCGQCVLSSTGMSCPMNCPKQLRNGPCGGVSNDGYCEVKPQMRCVWAEAWRGAGQFDGGLAAIQVVQAPVDRRMEGTSSWLRVVREKTGEPDPNAKKPAAAPAKAPPAAAKKEGTP